MGSGKSEGDQEEDSAWGNTFSHLLFLQKIVVTTENRNKEHVSKTLKLPRENHRLAGETLGSIDVWWNFIEGSLWGEKRVQKYSEGQCGSSREFYLQLSMGVEIT